MTSVLAHISSQLPQETNIDLVNSSRSGVIWYEPDDIELGFPINESVNAQYDAA